MNEVKGALIGDRLIPQCNRCPLLQGCGFEGFTAAELDFMQAFKTEHGHAWAGENLIGEGEARPWLVTLFSGWAAKLRALPSGGRQLIGVALPGDLLGADTLIGRRSPYAVEAVTDVTFCVFNPGRFQEMHANPGLARRIAQHQSLEIQRVVDRLTAVGAGDARQSVCHFLLDLYSRLLRLKMTASDSFRFPLTSTQFAEAVGLTTVHLHRVLRELRNNRIVEVEQRSVTIINMAALTELAAVPVHTEQTYPLL